VIDIGVTGSIYNLFHDYPKYRPYLSMHAKVHPPGPVALLWLISYGVGQDPLPLSLATMLIGVLALIPLFLWVREMTGERVAIIACMLYSLMPSTVLFTATSADILFMPIILLTLFFFWRALHRRSFLYAAAAGIAYAAASLMSFNLLAIGAFFALAGLWRFAQKEHRLAVAQTAIVMCAAFVAFHAAIRWWSGFDMIACFHACKEQLYLDQANLDLLQPRFPGWLWRILNPVCWFYFAGIPVSLLFIWRLLKPDQESRALFLVMAGSAIVMTLLYLARGEGERSAMYILPFIVVPAAHMLDSKTTAARCIAPMAATLIFLAFQCWFTESYFYTFW
jgi:hypothetical protein